MDLNAGQSIQTIYKNYTPLTLIWGCRDGLEPRGRPKKDHIKNEDIWREATVEPMTVSFRKRRLLWYDQGLRKKREDTTYIEYVKHPSVGKEKKGRLKKRWLDNISDDMKVYNMTEDVA